MIVTSHLHSTMSGKVARGLVYMRNQYHPIVARQYVIPVNPNSNLQLYSRTAFQKAVALWNGLGSAKWAAYKDWSEASGYSPSGRSAWIRNAAFYLYMKQLGFVVADMDTNVPPIIGQPLVEPNLTTFGGGPGTYGFTVKINNSTIYDIDLWWGRSPVQNGARNFYKGPWIDSSTFTTISALGSTTINVLFPLGAGIQCGFVRMRAMLRGSEQTPAFDGTWNAPEMILRGDLNIGV